jgi:hypothetical protein
MSSGQTPRVNTGFPTHNVAKNLYRNDTDSIIVKFGPLVIAIIAVCLCFYLYKKVNEIQNSRVNPALEEFMKIQNETNSGFQTAYNKMVEQFNSLSNVVHQVFIPPEGEQTSRIVEEDVEPPVELSTEVSNIPTPIQGSIQSYLKLDTVKEESEIHDAALTESTLNQLINDTSMIDDKDSEVSLSLSYKSDSLKQDIKKKRGRKPKNTLGVE